MGLGLGLGLGLVRSMLWFTAPAWWLWLLRLWLWWVVVRFGCFELRWGWEALCRAKLTPPQTHPLRPAPQRPPAPPQTTPPAV